MLKSGLKFLRMFVYRKPRRLTRTNPNWTEIYPSPEPSFLKKQVEKTCDWVYGNIDSFFQGSTKKSKPEFNDNPAGINEFGSGACQVWMLNQGLIDIAFKDIKASLNWLIPGFIRQFANRMHQQSLLYLFTDHIIEDGSSGSDLLIAPRVDSASGNTGNTIYVFREFKEENNSNLLSISDWWVRFTHKLGPFTRIEPQKKTYHLLCSFASPGYDYLLYNQNNMIRRPDKPKLNSTISFHKRN